MTNVETKSIEKIRAQYVEKDYTELDALKALDARVKRPANVFAYTYGSIGALVLGTGMCLAMGVIESIGTLMPLGIIIGLAGIGIVSSTYAIYKAILRSRKRKYSGQIFALSDSILNK